MNQLLLGVWSLFIGMTCNIALHANAQVCYDGVCYRQPEGARLVLPHDPPSSAPSSAHCRIFVDDGSVGSGTLIAKNDATGLVLTCSHLFDSGATNVVVAFPEGGRFGARLIDRDSANDLAALLIKTPEAESLPVNDDEPTGILTACGYGGSGQFRPISGAIAGAVQAIGATAPSLKIASAVRPSSSVFRALHFLPPYRLSSATVHANPVVQGCADLVGAVQGLTRPIGEVSS